MQKPLTPTESEWIDKFEKLYGDDFEGGFRDKLKDFLLQFSQAIRTEAVESERERIENEIKALREVAQLEMCGCNDYALAIEEVLTLIPPPKN